MLKTIPLASILLCVAGSLVSASIIPPYAGHPDAGANCTFNYGWCGWTMQTHYSNGWGRVSGKEPSGYQGWYIFFNGTLNAPGHTAAVVSPTVQTYRDNCFEFDLSSYQIPGQAYNVLSVSVLQHGYIKKTVQFRDHTNSGWVRKRVPVESRYSPYSIALSAVKNGYNNGYFAVDNIIVKPRRC